MKKKIFLIIVVAVIVTSIIYVLFKEEKKTYLALGDSIASGISPFGEKTYSYNDYVVELLQQKKALKEYYTEFIGKDLRTHDLINMIKDNVEADKNGKKITIQQALVKSDIITISIGSYDLYNHLGITNGGEPIKSNDELNKYLISMFTDLTNLIELVQKFTPGRIVIIGFYNPKIDADEKMKAIFEHIDSAYANIASEKGSGYISINKEISENPQFLTNINNIHINYKGHRLISEKIIEMLKL